MTAKLHNTCLRNGLVHLMTGMLLSLLLLPGSLKGADPPEDDDADILEMLFDRLTANQSHLHSYRATYRVISMDHTVIEPVTKVAKSVGGTAQMIYTLSPRTESSLQILADEQKLFAKTTDAAGQTTEIVKVDRAQDRWEFYQPPQKISEFMARADLPGRLPVNPADLWMQDIAQTPVDYLASEISDAAVDLHFDDHGHVILTSHRTLHASAAGKNSSRLLVIRFDQDAGLMPTFVAFGDDGHLTMVLTQHHRRLKNGAWLVDQVNIYYTPEKLTLSDKSPFVESLPPESLQQLSYNLMAVQEGPQHIPDIELLPGTEVRDNIRGSISSNVTINSDLSANDSRLRTLILLILVNGIVIAAIATYWWRRKHQKP